MLFNLYCTCLQRFVTDNPGSNPNDSGAPTAVLPVLTLLLILVARSPDLALIDGILRATPDIEARGPLYGSTALS